MLIKNGVVSEGELLALIAGAANVPPINLDRVQVNTDVLADVPVEVARQFKVLPIDKIGSLLTVAVANPFDVLKLDDVRIRTGCELRAVVSTEEAIERRIEVAYKSELEAAEDYYEALRISDLLLEDALAEQGQEPGR